MFLVVRKLVGIEELGDVVRKLVGIEELGDRWVFRFLLFVLVEYPFQGGAVAEFVVPGSSRNPSELGVFVEGDGALGFVGFEFGFGGVFAADFVTG